MKWIKFVIIGIIIAGIIFAATAYRNYQDKIYYEQIQEERRQADLEYKQKMEIQKEERFSQYILIGQIGSEYFEKNLTSIEIEKRKRRVINEIPGKIYNLYVQLIDIILKDGQKVITFSSPLLSFRSIVLGYEPITTIFYDNNSLFENEKTGTFWDIEAKVIKAVLNEDKIIIYLVVTKISKPPFWDDRIYKRDDYYYDY